MTLVRPSGAIGDLGGSEVNVGQKYWPLRDSDDVADARYFGHGHCLSFEYKNLNVIRAEPSIRSGMSKATVQFM